MNANTTESDETAIAKQRPRVVIEVLVDSVESASAAAEGGADRLEVCQNLFEGGTTPSAGLLARLGRTASVPWNVMIRPRGGDFCYSTAEHEVMREDIRIAKDLGAHGIVLGILTPEGGIDTTRVAELVELARPMSVTFHRAFDMIHDPIAGLEALIKLGVDRLLTSGLEPTVFEGAERIGSWIRHVGERLIIMPGGGIRESNVLRILDTTGAKEIHVSGSGTVQSRMQFRNTRVFMGRELRAPEFSWSAVDPGRIRAYRSLV